jgi:hypothetical protein
MPLNVPALIADIQQALKNQGGSISDPAAKAAMEASQLKLATDLADAIYKFVLSANPIPVVTSAGAGTATIS